MISPCTCQKENFCTMCFNKMCLHFLSNLERKLDVVFFFPLSHLFQTRKVENNLFLFSLSTFPNLASRNIFCILLIFICIACRIMEILQVTSLSWFWRTLQHAWVIVLGGMTFFLFGVIELVFYLFYGSWNSHFLLKQLFFFWISIKHYLIPLFYLVPPDWSSHFSHKSLISVVGEL